MKRKTSAEGKTDRLSVSLRSWECFVVGDVEIKVRGRRLRERVRKIVASVAGVERS